MANYQAFHYTARGYSHILKGTCCEDASASCNGEDLWIAVVSDGHGDPACFRSQVGSRLAVEIAVEQLTSFARNLREQGWEDHLFDGILRERLVRQLIRSIIGNWNVKIAEELAAQPVTEEEYAASRSYEQAYREGRELPHIFGCTLIALLMTDRYLLALQQGDGRCVVVRRDGTADQPVPWDSRCEGNICTSLCHEDAVESCRYYVADLGKEPLVACFAVSDGIEDSLDSQEDLNAFLCNVASIFAQEGLENLLAQLGEYLPRMSETGSADDMSVAGIVRGDIEEDMARLLSLVYELSVHRTVARGAVGKINSMQRKTDFLREALDRAQAEYDQIEHALHENMGLMERLKRELRRVIRVKDNQELILDTAKNKLAEAREAFESHDAKRQVFVEKVRTAEEAAQTAQQELEALLQRMPVELTEEPGPEQPDWELAEPLVWEEEECPEESDPETEVPEGAEEEPLPEAFALTAEQPFTENQDDFC